MNNKEYIDLLTYLLTCICLYAFICIQMCTYANV